MEQSLKEQLAAAHAELQRCGAEQRRLSTASTEIHDEIRRLTDLKTAADSAQEEAAQMSARHLIGEASDDELARARDVEERAATAASGADRLIAQRQRASELIHERYMAAIAPGTAAQNVCNQFRAAILHKSADESAAEYINAVSAARDALVKLLGHAKALSRVQGAEPFVSYFHAKMDLPAFPTLQAFRPNPHHRLDVVVGLNGDVDAAADQIVGKLRDDGYAF